MSASTIAMSGGSAVMTALHTRKSPMSSSPYLGNSLEAYALARMEKLLGTSVMAGGQPTTSSVTSETDVAADLAGAGGELREEDIWATEARDWQQQEGPKGLSFQKEGGGVRMISRQSRWMGGRERDLGLASWNDDSISSKHRTTLLSPFRSYANASPQRIFGAPTRAKSEAPPPAMIQQSAPVNVPAWGKLAERDENGKVKRGGDIDSDEEEDSKIVPPHELIARQNAESGVVFSVYEGAGRTLKGRDAKRVRNAVLRQTGFFD